MTTEALFEMLTTHCFWGICSHAETGIDHDTVHAAMEAHYATAHTADIDRLIPPVAQ